MKVMHLIGNATKDSEVQENERGDFLKFSVAVKDGYGANAGVLYFDCTSNKVQLRDYIKKGTKVALFGDLSVRQYQNKQGEQRSSMTVRAVNIELIGPKNNTEQDTNHDRQEKPAGTMDDEIPF